MDLAPGLQVTPNLRLVRKLGQGGMGSVWVADHLTLHTQLALKFVSTEHASDAVARERFSREAAAAAQMKHPHVVQVFDHGVSVQGLPFIAMELLEGEDLGRRIGRVGRLSLQQTNVIIGQACKALGRAHSMGLVHRDIKPDNIFLTDLDGETFVKVLDFGIAKHLDPSAKSVTSTGTMIGTPYYMSPEQLTSAKHVDPRADLWSIAVVAYHCLTGRVPFDGDALGAVFIAIDRGKFAPPTQLVPGLPASVDAWFARALASEPSARFSTAKELAQRFDDAVRGHAGEPVAPQQPVLDVSRTFAGAIATSPAVAQLERLGSSSQDASVPVPVRAPTLGGAAVTSADRTRRAWPAMAVAAVVIAALAFGVGAVAWRSWSSAARAAASSASVEPPPAATPPEPQEPALAASASAPPEVPQLEPIPAAAPPPREAKHSEPAVASAPPSSPPAASTPASAPPVPPSASATTKRRRDYGF